MHSKDNNDTDISLLNFEKLYWSFYLPCNWTRYSRMALCLYIQIFLFYSISINATCHELHLQIRNAKTLGKIRNRSSFHCYNRMKTRSYLFVYDETVFSNELHISYLIYCPSNYVFYYHHVYSIHIVWYLFHKRYRYSQSKVPDYICCGLISPKNNN